MLSSVIALIVTIVSSYGESPTKPYRTLALSSDLIVVGKITSVNFEKRIFGQAGGKPYYTTYQDVIFDIEKVLKGSPKSNPLVIQSTTSFLGDPEFQQNEKVIVLLKWFEDPLYGNYYALVGRAAGKFSIKVNTASGSRSVSNEVLMGEEWNMDMTDFLEELNVK